MKQKSPGRKSNVYIRFSSVAIQMAAVISVFTWLGVYLDDYFRSETPWLTIVLSLFGVIGSLALVIREVLKLDFKTMIQRIIRQFILIAVWILVSIILTHVLIHQVSTFYNLLNASVLLFIFLGSTVLVNYKIEKNPKRFIGNFLVMTTHSCLSF